MATWTRTVISRPTRGPAASLEAHAVRVQLSFYIQSSKQAVRVPFQVQLSGRLAVMELPPPASSLLFSESRLPVLVKSETLSPNPLNPSTPHAPSSGRRYPRSDPGPSSATSQAAALDPARRPSGRRPGSSPPSLRPPPPLASVEALRRRRKQLRRARLGGLEENAAATPNRAWRRQGPALRRSALPASCFQSE